MTPTAETAGGRIAGPCIYALLAPQYQGGACAGAAKGTPGMPGDNSGPTLTNALGQALQGVRQRGSISARTVQRSGNLHTPDQVLDACNWPSDRDPPFAGMVTR